MLVSRKVVSLRATRGPQEGDKKQEVFLPRQSLNVKTNKELANSVEERKTPKVEDDDQDDNYYRDDGQDDSADWAADLVGGGIFASLQLQVNQWVLIVMRIDANNPNTCTMHFNSSTYEADIVETPHYKTLANITALCKGALRANQVVNWDAEKWNFEASEWIPLTWPRQSRTFDSGLLAVTYLYLFLKQPE